MKKKIFSVVATLLLSCYFAFAQNGGIPVEIKPLNPPTKPPEFMISTDGLIPGVYFMRIYRNGEFLDTQKLIVK